MARKAETAELTDEVAEARFSRLYADHGREVLAYALRRAAGAEDAGDIVAETFLVAWRRIAEIPAGEDARLWLYGTARRVLANQRRGELRRGRLGERLREAVARELPGASVSEPDEDGVVLRALSGLGAADRELLMLVGWEELTPTQVARVLEISPLAVRSRLHRARRRLRILLSEADEDEHGTTKLELEEAR